MSDPSESDISQRQSILLKNLQRDQQSGIFEEPSIPPFEPHISNQSEQIPDLIHQDQPKSTQSTHSNSTHYDNSNTKSGKDSLGQLISDLTQKIQDHDSHIIKIKHPQMLLESLNEMNDMIGMDRLKESVALQVMRLIEALNTGQTNLGMLNTILYGEPGVGKTRVGITLAKIWYSLGFLDSNASTDSSISQSISGMSAEELGSAIAIGIGSLVYAWSMLASLYKTIGFIMLAIIAIVITVIIIFWWWLRRDNHHDSSQNKSVDGNNKSSSQEFDRKIINVVSRDDFVAGYVGQTAPKTVKLLQANLGKVLFIDEAYSLFNDGGFGSDSFGMEALTALNLFLSENENKIVVIFAGYKNLMQSGIFKIQPGLPRRCMWHFECDGYDGDQLGDIFMLQLREEGWSVDDEYAVKDIISKNKQMFPSFGGDTKRLIFFAQLAASKNTFYSSNESGKILTTKDIEEGIKFLQENNIHTHDNVSNPVSTCSNSSKLSHLFNEFARSSSTQPNPYNPDDLIRNSEISTNPELVQQLFEDPRIEEL